MKTSLKKRFMRLGILCAGIGSFAVAIFASVAIILVEDGLAYNLGKTVAESVMGSFEEEIGYLSSGLENAAPGEENDIFSDVFILGETKSYDYSSFKRECDSLSAGKITMTYLPSADISLAALNRGTDTIVGTLPGDYFDYVVAIMKKSGGSGYIARAGDGRILLSTNKRESGGSLSGNDVFSENLIKAKSGVSARTGGVFSGNVVFSEVVPGAKEFCVFYCENSDNIYGGGKTAIILLFLWSAILTVTGVIVSIGVAKEIANSIIPTAECLDKFSRGEINTDFRANTRGDETETLSAAMETTIGNLGSYIRDIDYVLSEMSGGNFSVTSTCEYAGEFNNIKQSLNTISSSLKLAFGTIRDAGAQVTSGISSLASGAQSLAENSSSEAGTLKELDTLVNSINENVAANAEMTDRMRVLSEQTVECVHAGNANMNNLSSAIEDIRKASEEIQSIAKLIDDIAFQTNILALNAAVEAARAGDAGKGFAVVADEVRNLAGKSAEAAKNAVNVIGRCVDAVDQGVKLNRSASESLNQVSDSVQEFSVLVGRVADSSARQANDIKTVTNGLSRITDTVQSNAATAQESAASSEEISSQAQLLEEELSKFRT